MVHKYSLSGIIFHIGVMIANEHWIINYPWNIEQIDRKFPLSGVMIHYEKIECWITNSSHCV